MWSSIVGQVLPPLVSQVSIERCTHALPCLWHAWISRCKTRKQAFYPGCPYGPQHNQNAKSPGPWLATKVNSCEMVLAGSLLTYPIYATEWVNVLPASVGDRSTAEKKSRKLFFSRVLGNVRINVLNNLYHHLTNFSSNMNGLGRFRVRCEKGQSSISATGRRDLFEPTG